MVILGAGLRGAGHDVTDGQVAMMQAPGGVAGFAAVIADLLAATFGDPEMDDPAATECESVVMLPWALLMERAAKQLSWSPPIFWSATLKELEQALGLATAVKPPDRKRLQTLMDQFPDT